MRDLLMYYHPARKLIYMAWAKEDDRGSRLDSAGRSASFRVEGSPERKKMKKRLDSP